MRNNLAHGAKLLRSGSTSPLDSGALKRCVEALGHQDAGPGHTNARPLQLLLEDLRSSLKRINLVHAERAYPLPHIVLGRRTH